MSKKSESHLWAVMPAIKGIDAFVLGTLKEMLRMVPLLKE